MIDVMQFEAPLVDASGNQIGWMGSILDITERKQSEERERRQVEALANNARLTMLGEIASTLAHELNQPLTAIVSYNAGAINYLKRQPQPDSVLSGALQRLGEQAAHAGSIVQRIREFLTRRTPRREPCDINGLVRDGLKLLAREMKRRDIQVGFQAGAALPEVRADRVLIEQIVINLVRNAADALAACSGERRIEVESGVDLERNEVFIAVADNGKGLGDLSVEQLCSPFFSTKPEGMGMGLAICRSIVEAHQGRFTAGAAKLGGANFTVWLPLASNREENS
jgi:two-component system sensor histidine kinase DctS